jgi:O-antigen/teichoic acid export membrane protein
MKLAEKARLAVFWTTGFQIFWDLLQFGLTLVLVRMLPAEAYGQFGFVTAVIGFLTLYSFREMLGHTLQLRDDAQVDYQTHFTAGLAIQTAMFGVANAIAVGLRWLPAYAAAAPALHLMSLIFLLDLPSELRVKMLERLLEWRRLRLLHAIGLIISAALSIGLALRGWGVFALLLPTFLVPAPFLYDLFVVERWRPTWRFNRAGYAEAWRYGSARMLSVSFVSGAGLVESSWLVRGMGFTAFGVFGRATGLAQRSCQRIGAVVASSLYPVLTRLEPRSDAYRQASALFLRSVAWVVAPIAAICALLATEVVHLLYGGRWNDVAPLLPWAMAAGAIAALVQAAYTLLLAHQRQRECLNADIWRLAGTVMALALAFPFGLRAYLAGVTLMHLMSLAMILRWLARDRAVAWRGVARALAPAIVAALVAWAVTGSVKTLAGDDARGLSAPIAQGALFVSVYLLTLRVGFGDALRELVGYLPERRRLHRWLRFQEAA